MAVYFFSLWTENQRDCWKQGPHQSSHFTPFTASLFAPCGQSSPSLWPWCQVPFDLGPPLPTPPTPSLPLRCELCKPRGIPTPHAIARQVEAPKNPIQRERGKRRRIPVVSPSTEGHREELPQSSTDSIQKSYKHSKLNCLPFSSITTQSSFNSPSIKKYQKTFLP